MSEMSIFTPTNAKIIATPVLRNLKVIINLANRKNRALSPNMANILEEKTINGSVDIARIAGIESMANMMSELSTAAISNNKGVADNFPICLMNSRFP